MTDVVSTGRFVSIRIVWTFQPELWPSPSVKRVRSVWMPWPVTVMSTGPAPMTVSERASSTSSQSIWVTPLPTLSVPVMWTSTEELLVVQPDGTVVLSTGPAASTRTT